MPRFMHQVRAIPGELNSLPRSVKGVSLVIFLYYLGWATIQPFLPIYFTEILGSYGSATLVVSLLYLFGAVWSFPVGEFVDRYSKKKWLRIILLLYLPLWPWLALLQTVTQFVFFRLYHSFLSINLWGAADSYLRFHSPEKHQSESWGLYDIGTSSAMIIGAILGGALLLVLKMPVVILTVPAAAVLLAFFVSRFLPEVPGTQSFTESMRTIDWRNLYRKELRDYWSHPALRRLLIFSVIIGVLSFPQITLLPLLADSFGQSSFSIGLLYALFIAPLLLEAPFSVLADRWSRRALLVIGSGIAAATFIGIATVSASIALFPLVVVLGIAAAMMKPVVSGAATTLMDHDHIGEMNAVYTASSSLGGFVSLVVMGRLADTYGIHLPFLISSFLMLLFLGLAVFLWPRIERRLQERNTTAL